MKLIQVLFLILAQDIYFPVSGPFIRPVPLSSGPNLITGIQFAPQQMVIVLTDRIKGAYLFADPDPIKGQQAVDDCTAGITQPINPTATTPSCEQWRQVGMQDDINARVRGIINNVPAAQLTAAKLRFVQ